MSIKKPFYPFILDHKPGFLLNWFLYTLFKRVHFDENMTESLREMRRQGTVIYAMKYRGHLDYLLYHYRFRRSRLPYPKISFDMNMSMFLPLSHLFNVLKFYTVYFIKHKRFPNPFKSGFFEDSIKQGTSSLFCLVDPKGFARHFIHSEKDSLHFLLETQKDMESAIYIVPQLILYKKTPEKEYSNLLDIFFGFKERPGVIRKIVLFFRHHRRAFIDFGKPLNLKTYLKQQTASRSMEEMATEIRQMLIESIDMQKRVILGPVRKSRQQLKEIVLKEEEIANSIEDMAAGNAKQLKQLRKKAGDYFDEIAADYNIAYVQFFHRFLKWVWKKIFQGIDVNTEELAVVRDWARKKGPVIYIPSHKSHIDYLVINYILFDYHMHIPRVAAGKNLSFWPLGHIFKKSGAFFIRRTFKGAPLYAKVFKRYIKALLKEGDPLEFYIEGGRSRSGKLILPKIGFLSILLQAYQEGYCDDLIFVPASISYDKILEEKSYLKELGGAEKEKESFKQVLKSRSFLKKKYGKIYVRFGRPLSLKEYLSQIGDPGKTVHRLLAFHLIQSINKVTLVTPLALIATAILTKHRRGFHLHELTSTAKMLFDFLKKNRTPTATSLNNFEKTVEETISLLISNKGVSLLKDVDGMETFYYVDDEKKLELEYYKNNIIHCFISYSFVAVSLLTETEEMKSNESILTDYRFLKELFKNEFVYDSNEDIQEEINKITSYFLDVSFMTHTSMNEGFKLTRLGFDNLPVWAAMAKTFLESYWVVTQSLIQLENKNIKTANLLKSTNNLAQRFHKLGLIDHVEAISQLNFKNAIAFMNNNILESTENLEKEPSKNKAELSRLNQQLYKLSHYSA